MPSPATTPSFSWNERAAEQLRNLVDRPWLLLLVLLAANAVARPYGNVAHDTRLYSVQVINRVENGIFDNDLFFRYGSQDSFSIFSKLMAPLVQMLGLDWAFFLVYLIGTIALFASLIQLVCRLVDDRLIALVTLLYMAVAPLTYGGQAMLNVHESFLTPRLLSAAAVLFGLDLLIRARYGPSLALIVGAGLIHPLMAVGGLFLWTGVVMVDKLGARRAALIAGGLALAGALVLAIPSVGRRVFGTMDQEWCDAIRCGSPFTFPAEWDGRDWMNVALCLFAAGIGVAFYYKDNPGRARFFTILMLLGLAASLGNIIAFNLPYALLMQGQPFRSLWILKVFEVPLCFLLAFQLWRSGFFAQQLLGLGLLWLLFAGWPTQTEYAAFLMLLPTCIIFVRGLKAESRSPAWMIQSTAMALALTQFAWMMYLETSHIGADAVLSRNLDAFDLVHSHLDVFGTLPWMAVFLGLVLCFTRAGKERALGITCASVFAAVQMFYFTVPNTSYVHAHGCCYYPDIQYARDFLHSRQTPGGKLPTVYSAYGKIEYVWLEFKANNYFDWWESGGFIFQRPMAIEGQRRAKVAAPFEVARFRGFESFLHDRLKFNVQRFFRRDLDSPDPTIDDLARLCHEPELDYAVLKQNLGNLYEATNGSVYIYDCRRVRAALKMPVDSHGAVAGLTPSRTEVISP